MLLQKSFQFKKQHSMTIYTNLDLQICVVTPLPVIDARFMVWNVPDPVRSFYRTNNVDEFYFDRPFHQGAKDANNDFKVLIFMVEI